MMYAWKLDVPECAGAVHVNVPCDDPLFETLPMTDEQLTAIGSPVFKLMFAPRTVPPVQVRPALPRTYACFCGTNSLKPGVAVRLPFAVVR